MRDLLSVIVPVYNTEMTVERTIGSVTVQTWDNIEIIIVEDGSPDKAGKLCDKLAEKDDRIKVIHKENAGLGMARNTGLNVAVGRYVAFLDSDDWIEPETYKSCIEYMRENSLQACYYGRKVYNKNGKYKVVDKKPVKTLYKGDEVVKEFAIRYFGDWDTNPEDMYVRESVCCALYDRDFIEEHSLRFMSERECLSEDTFFNLDICRHAEGIGILCEDLYDQGYNPASLTRKKDDTKVMKLKPMYHYLGEYSLKFPEIEDVGMRIRYKIISLVRGYIKDNIREEKNVGRSLTYIRRVVNDDMFNDIFNSFDNGLVDKNSRIVIGLLKSKAVCRILILYRISLMMS